MPRFVWLLALCLGCEDEVVPIQQAKNKKSKEEVIEEDAVRDLTPEQKVESMRHQVLAGETGTIVEDAKALLSERPEDSVLWMVLEHASLEQDQGASLLATLDPANPLAGQAKRSEDLRQRLITSRQDLASLKERAAKSTGAEQAVLQARIEMVENPGLAFDRKAPRDSPKDALVQFSRASTPRDASLFEVAAVAVEGVDAALFRTEAWLTLGAKTRAFDELAAVAESGNLDQAAAARLQMCQLVLDGALAGDDKREVPSLDQVMEWALEVTSASLRDSDRHTMMQGLEIVVEVGIQTGKLDLAMAQASQVDLALSMSAGDAEQSARAKTLLSRVAYRAGRVRTAMHVGMGGMVLQAKSSPEAAWWGGLAAFQLEYGATVEDAAAKAKGARARVLEALAHAAQGDMATAGELFDASALGAEDRALVLPLMAALDPTTSLARHREAIKSADESGDIALKIRTRLDLEAELRAQHKNAASRGVRAELLALADNDAMKSELAARSMLAGESGQGFPAGDKPALVQLWASLSNGSTPPTSTDEALTAPLLSWAKGRNELRGGNSGYSQYNSTLNTLPAHRQGRLSAGTALDGSMGLPVAMELKQVSGSNSRQDLGVALVLHEIFHRISQVRADLGTGRSLTFALHHGPKQDILGAASRARSQVDRWLAGQADYPERAFEAVLKAERHIQGHVDNLETGVTGYERTFHKLMPARGWDIKELVDYLRDRSIALISYQQFGDRMHGVALCTHGSHSGDLGLARAVDTEASAHTESMRSLSMDGDRDPDHLPGHRLRTQLFDPLKSAFVTEGRDGGGGAKVGKYVVIAPPNLLNFNFGSLAVNQDGLQVLGRAYSFYSYSSLSSVDHNDRVQAMVTKPVFLGMTVPGEKVAETSDAQVGLTDEELIRQSRSKLNLPPDISNAAARFETSGMVLERQKVTLSTWSEWIRGARYIYLSEFSAGPNGEFKVHDGMVSLDDIRAHPIRAELVAISAKAPLDQQLARARAFIEAGAQTVLILGWEIPDSDIESVIPEFLSKATSNKVTGARMSLELKKILAIESDVPGENKYRTAVRGSFLLFSAL